MEGWLRNVHLGRRSYLGLHQHPFTTYSAWTDLFNLLKPETSFSLSPALDHVMVHNVWSFCHLSYSPWVCRSTRFGWLFNGKLYSLWARKLRHKILSSNKIALLNKYCATYQLSVKGISQFKVFFVNEVKLRIHNDGDSMSWLNDTAE